MNLVFLGSGVCGLKTGVNVVKWGGFMKRNHYFALSVLALLLAYCGVSYGVARWRVEELKETYSLNFARHAAAMAKMLRVGPLSDFFSSGVLPNAATHDLIVRDLQLYAKAVKVPDVWLLLNAWDGLRLGAAVGKPDFLRMEQPSGKVVELPRELAEAFKSSPGQFVAQSANLKQGDGSTLPVYFMPVFNPRTGELRYVVGGSPNHDEWMSTVAGVIWRVWLVHLPLMVLLGGWLYLLFYRDALGRWKKYRGYVEAVLVVCVSLAVVFPLATALEAHERHGFYRTFAQQVDLHVDRLMGRLNGVENQIFNAADRLEEISGELTEDVFRAFVAPFQVQRCFSGVVTLERVSEGERGAFEERLRKFEAEFPHIWQRGTGEQRVPAEKADVYYPMVFDSNGPATQRRLLGFDFASEPVRLAAIEKALQTRTTAVSDLITYVSDNRSHQGILMIHPVFSRKAPERLFALFSVSLRLVDGLQSITGRYATERNTLILDIFALDEDGRFRYFDSSVPEQAKPSFAYVPVIERLQNPKQFSFFIPLFYFDRMMVICAHPGSAFFGVHPFSTRHLVLLIGLVVAPLLGVIVLIIRKRQAALTKLVRVRVMEMIEQSERLVEITENVPAVLWELDLASLKFTYFSKYVETYAILAIDDEWESFLEHLHPQDVETFRQESLQHFKSGEPLVQEFRLIDKKGQIYWIHQQVTFALENGKPVRAIGISNDITERKLAAENLEKMDVALRNAQRLEAVGLLAGGIAHDFNNMLQVMLGNTELVLANVDTSDPNFADLSDIQKAAQKASGITRQLLAFARKQAVAPELQDLNVTIRENMQILRRLAGEGISVDFDPALVPCVVSIDPSQINQVVTNLVVNARDAIRSMSTAGSIKLTLAPVHLRDMTCTSGQTLPDGDYVCLMVADSGSGMDAATISKIFDPFFSTKARGKGTGLGLSTIHGILSQNKGGINVKSTLGSGTTFSLYFPQHKGEGEEESVSVAPRVSLQDLHGTGTILVVEDDEEILNLTQSTLLSLGYEVIVCMRGADAIDILKNLSSKVDLVLVDMIMPEMSGLQLARRIREMFEGVPVVFMSASPESVMEDHPEDFATTKLLMKPFGCADLGLFIKRSLEPAVED